VPTFDPTIGSKGYLGFRREPRVVDRSLLVGLAHCAGRPGDQCPTDHQSRVEGQHITCVLC
jgi:hypothetical protein